LKSALYQSIHANKSFNKNPANHQLYYALMEALIEDENAMDKGVADTIKDHKRKHDNDEDPPAGPNQGKKTKMRRIKESESSKKPSVIKETQKVKLIIKALKLKGERPREFHFTLLYELPSLSLSLSISLGFDDQFLKLSFDSSLVSTVKDSADADSYVPTVVDSYIYTKVRDVFQKELQEHMADLIHKYSLQHLPELTKKLTPTAEQESEKSLSEIIKIKKEQAGSQKNP
nr:hypothetical protein [Tanacetum cinerariifolium]